MAHGTDWYENSRDGQLHMADTWLTVFQTKAQGWGIPAELPKNLRLFGLGVCA